MNAGAVASTTAKVGLAVAGVGVAAWTLSRALDQTSPGDSGGGYQPSPGYGTPYVPPYNGPTSGGDTGGHGGYPTDPGGYVPDPGGYVPDRGGYAPGHGGYVPDYDPYLPTDPYVPVDPYYPTDPGGYIPSWPTFPSGGSMWSAISSAAPRSWSSSDISAVASAAHGAGSSTWEAADMVRQVYNSTPYSWSGRQEAHVAATGLLTGRGAHDTGRVIDQVEWATPSHWSTNSDVRLAVAALRGGVPTSQVDDIIRSATRYGGSQSSSVASAESMLLAGGGMPGSYPMPGYPHDGTSRGDTYLY